MESPNLYLLGGQIADEASRLLQQGLGLQREARWLLDHIGVGPRWRTVDVGCGPLGVLDLLAERVGPNGEVVGFERDKRLVEMGQAIVAQRGLGNVHFVLGDAYNTGLPRGSFDFVHTRLLLINLKDPGRALTELVALARPGGVVAVEDINQVPWLCEPPHPAWDALVNAFLLVWRENGLESIDRTPAPGTPPGGRVNRRESGSARPNGPAGSYHRKHVLALIEAARDEVIRQAHLSASELEALKSALER